MVKATATPEQQCGDGYSKVLVLATAVASQQAATAKALGQLCFSVENDSLVPPAGQEKLQQCNI